MTSKMITIKNGIPLPKSILAQWKNKQASIRFNGDTIVVKRLETPAWGDLLPKLRWAGKRISKKDVESAVRSAKRSA